MNMLVLSMLLSAGISGVIASHKARWPLLWLSLGLITGPIAVAIILWLPSRAASTLPAIAPPRSIVDEINGLDEMLQRGIISEAEFGQGKAQVLAWPLSSAIPPALTPQRVWKDGRRTWASYHPATRGAIDALARRHALQFRWREDIPLEVVATFPTQEGLLIPFSIGLEKGSILCWGEAWDLGSAELHRPDEGLPSALDYALDALIDGSGRLLIRTAPGSSTPFCVSLQVRSGERWRTAKRRCSIPSWPFWRSCIVTNELMDQGEGCSDSQPSSSVKRPLPADESTCPPTSADP